MTAAPGRIDVHHHFIPAGYHERLLAREPAVLRGMVFPAWSAEGALALMDANGIGVSLISPPVWGLVIEDPGFARENARWCNEAAAAIVASHPGRFGAFASLPLLDVPSALDELAFALDTLHLDGVVLPASAGPHYLGAAHFDPLFAELDRRHVVVHVHPGTPADCGGFTPAVPDPVVEFVFDTTRAIANLAATGALERFPGIRFIFSHAGGTVPFLAGRLTTLDNNPAIRERMPRPVRDYLRALYYDVALAANPAALGALFQLVAPSQVLFGSDWPFAPAPVTTATVSVLEAYPGLDTSSRALIARENALQLFPRLG